MALSLADKRRTVRRKGQAQGRAYRKALSVKRRVDDVHTYGPPAGTCAPGDLDKMFMVAPFEQEMKPTN